MNPYESIDTTTTSDGARTPQPRARLLSVINELSLTERGLFMILLATALVSGLVLLLDLTKRFTVEIPSPGGTVREGIIGTPRFINPLLAISDADRDMTVLVYSGLLHTTIDGELLPDLAETYSISDDKKTYTFTIREDAVFHDGTPVTSDDVIFTIERAQDPLVKSPKRANWEGVVVEKKDSRTVTFTLKQPYAPFIENMTLGILPQHIWKETDAETFSFSPINTEPIGSGPYKIASIKTNSSRVPTLYHLVPFSKYTLGKPYIRNIYMRFYSSEQTLLEGYERGEVDSINTISPEYADKAQVRNARIETTPLPRIFGLFFNQNQAPVFTLAEVRQALDISAPREEIVNGVLLGYGSIVDGPIPPRLLPQVPATTTAATTSPLALATSTAPVATTTPAIELAQRLLAKNGWKLNETSGVLEKKTKTQTYKLEFSISTGNAPDLKKTAEILKSEWEKLGAKIEIKTFDLGDLNQTVIRPRKYDALLFGEIIGRDLDLFAFWHSSQRNDPGLNIALYTNSKVDKILEDVRSISDPANRATKYLQFESEIRKDVPAIFLYSPNFIYIIPGNVKGFSIAYATVPSERFENVNEWHIETDRVWNIFAPKQTY